MGRVYRTRQQTAILEYMAAQPGHHTAEQMVEHFRTQGVAIGVATVYRQLDKLAEQGMVRRYFLGAGAAACYEYAGEGQGCEAHFHLKCEGCGGLTHLSCGQLAGIQQHVAQSHSFTVNPAKTVFYGMCDNCREKNK